MTHNSFRSFEHVPDDPLNYCCDDTSPNNLVNSTQSVRVLSCCNLHGLDYSGVWDTIAATHPRLYRSLSTLKVNCERFRCPNRTLCFDFAAPLSVSALFWQGQRQARLKNKPGEADPSSALDAFSRPTLEGPLVVRGHHKHQQHLLGQKEIVRENLLCPSFLFIASGGRGSVENLQVPSGLSHRETIVLRRL